MLTHYIGQKLTDKELSELPLGSIIRNMYDELWLRVDLACKWERSAFTYKAKSTPNYGFYLEYLPPKPLEVGDAVTWNEIQKLPAGSLVCNNSGGYYLGGGGTGWYLESDGYFVKNPNYLDKVYTIAYLGETK